MSSEIEHLFKLLDDENQQCASVAMMKLLDYDTDLAPLLQEFQESENPRLRRRVHQLQRILTIRRHRSSLPGKLQNSNLDLFKGLTELHLLWYDNDSDDNIIQLWQGVIENAKKYRPTKIEKLAYFMQRYGFAVSLNKEIEADYYCIGTVLEELMGSDFILCAIAREVARKWGFELKIVRLLGNFVLINDIGQVLSPMGGWKILPPLKQDTYAVWKDSALLKLTLSMLFLCSISSDSFRYINTIGLCLAGLENKDNLDFLPYPYHSRVIDRR